MSLDYNNLEDKTYNIITNLQSMNDNIFVLKKKIILLDNINKKLEKNKMLKHDNNNNLLFQSNILKNEYSYYTNIYDIILDKYSKELYELSEYILIIIIALNKLEIENNDSKQLIYNKIIYTKQLGNINTGKLKEIINNIINNLKIVDEFIKLFDSYINKLTLDNSDKNIHNNNFELAIKYKKESIILEYNKYCDKFIKIIDYFKDCTDCVIKQIETSQLLKFFMKLKATS